jgi:hypothetical protein
MKSETIIMVIAVAVIVITLVGVVYRRLPKRLKPDYFLMKWRDLQGLCAHKDAWPQAIIAADDLLYEALKKRRYKGKNMGERLAAAQHELTDNDAIWTAHNLYKKIKNKEKTRLRENEVKKALMGFRQALKDIGALK